jgi:cell division protein FtsL
MLLIRISGTFGISAIASVWRGSDFFRLLMGMTMPDDNELYKYCADRIEAHFEEIEREAVRRFEDKNRELLRFMDDQRHGMEQRVKEVEDRVTRDMRTKVLYIGVTMVATAAAAMVLGLFAAARDVNKSVIDLQKDIIAAQATIRTSSEAINEHTKKLLDAHAELSTTTSQLDKARAAYDELTKATRAVQQAPRQ